MHLYELSNELKDLLYNHEDDANLSDILQDLKMKESEKILDISCYIKDLSSLKEAISEEQKKLADRKSRLNSRIENLKKYILNNMTEKNYEDSRVKVSSRLSPPRLVIDREEEILDIFREEIVTLRIKKDEIKDMLKNGVSIDGAHLEQDPYLKID